MIPHEDIKDLVIEWGVREDIVEKDYAIGWLLWAIGTDPRLQATWVFKGGTCLKKCFLETYRFSEDLDFTVMPGGPITPEELDPIFTDLLAKVTTESGIDFTAMPHRFRQTGDPLSIEGRVYYRGPRASPSPGRVKIDLLGSEKLVTHPLLRQVSHPFPDDLPPPGHVLCYSFEELFAEKTRALGERCRPRDLYDVINLYRRDDSVVDPKVLQQVLAEKCASKGISVPTADLILSSDTMPELRAEWGNMLEHQLPSLPTIESFLDAIPEFFQWIEGTLEPKKLPRASATVPEDRTWSPPPSTIRSWGLRFPLEKVRFAAANRLCVELGYQGSKRLIEPYSLRRTEEGNILLCAVRSDNQEFRCYRTDRIQSVHVTNIPFSPTYEIEFSSNAPVVTGRVRPQATRQSARPVSVRRRSQQTGPVYVIQCPSCGRRFNRKKQNTVLRPHKDKNGWNCPCRRGYVADVRYR